MKNKKSLTRIFGLVLGFSVLFIFIFFSIIFIRDIGKTEILDRLDNYTYQVEDDFGLSAEMKTHIHEFPSEYENISVPYDLYFLLSFISMFLFTLFTSYKSKEVGIFSFFGYITFGIIICLFMLSFIELINDWIILNFINGFLEFDLNSVPLINFYILNLPIINLFWISIIILVNKLNFTRQREEAEDLIIGGDFER